MTENEITEMLGRIDASEKLAMVAIEMVVALSIKLGTRIDLRSFATAMLNSETVDALNAQDFEVERLGRKRVADVLRVMADRLDQGG